MMFSFVGFLATVVIGIVLQRMFGGHIDKLVGKFLGMFKKEEK